MLRKRDLSISEDSISDKIKCFLYPLFLCINRVCLRIEYSVNLSRSLWASLTVCNGPRQSSHYSHGKWEESERKRKRRRKKLTWRNTFLRADVRNVYFSLERCNAHNADVQGTSFTRALRCGCCFYTLLDPLVLQRARTHYNISMDSIAIPRGIMKTLRRR